MKKILFPLLAAILIIGCSKKTDSTVTPPVTTITANDFAGSWTAYDTTSANAARTQAFTMTKLNDHRLTISNFPYASFTFEIPAAVKDTQYTQMGTIPIVTSPTVIHIVSATKFTYTYHYVYYSAEEDHRGTCIKN